MTVHDFGRSLAESHTQGNDEVFWEAVYRSVFPTYQGMVYLRDNGLAQRSGVDRHISLANGRVMRIEEKIRSKNYDDFCLEYWSVHMGANDPQNKVGWMEKDLACDFIAYAFMPSMQVYFLPWPQLRLAWLQQRRSWIQSFRKVVAHNDGYDTISVAVPIDVVLGAISDVTLIQLPVEAVAA